MLIGPVSDHMVISWREKRGGVWYPEDRLRAALLPILVVIPGSILVLGLADRYIDGTPGLVITLMCLFANGMGVCHHVVLLFKLTGIRLTWLSAHVRRILSM